MKIKAVAAALLFLSALAYSAEKKICHAQTKYFDIIFDENSKNTAARIYGCADSELERLCSEYKTKPLARIPVVITSATDTFNGYFTNYNYNHIVLYDTTPDKTMLVFDDTMKSTFIHELTHLVTTNSSSGFWTATQKILGDIYNPGYYITLPTFIKEGASVHEESRKGEGRLNNGVFLHYIKQAKLSGKFPQWSDCFGSRSIYPSTTASYIFGSAFTQFIVEKYGMEKYTEFWYNGINMKGITTSGAFRKTYGTSMKSEWKKFYESIDVSEIDSNPESTDGIKKTVTDEKSLHRYAIAGTTPAGLAVLDETTGSLRIGQKKIFTKGFLESAKITGCGKYICVTETDINHMSKKISASYLDVEKNKWTDLGSGWTKDFCVYDSEDKKIIACIKNTGQNCSLVLCGAMDKKAELARHDFDDGQIPYGLNGDSDGNFFFFLKDAEKIFLCKGSFLNGILSIKKHELECDTPMDLSVSKDSDGNTAIAFSFCDSKSFPRPAKGKFSDGLLEIEFLHKDVSGGFYSPVVCGENILYSAHFYDENSIFSLDCGSFNFESKKIPGLLLEPSSKTPAEIPQEEISTYRKILYPGQTIVPLSTLQSYYIGPSVYFTRESDCLGTGSVYPLGMTVIKNNPSDTLNMGITAGFNPMEKSGGAGTIFILRNSSDSMTMTNTTCCIFDKDGFMQSSNNLNLSMEFSIGDISRIVLSESNIFVYGKNDMDEERMKDFFIRDRQLEDNYIYDRNIISLTYSNIHKTGERSYEKFGFAAGINYKNVFASCCGNDDSSIFFRLNNCNDSCIRYSQLYPAVKLSLPQILPVDNRNYFTFNLPVTFYGALVPTNNIFAEYETDAVLFSWEAQKGLGVIPFYVHNISLIASYSGEFVNFLNRDMEIFHLDEDFRELGSMQKNEYAGARIVFKSGINSGALASPSFYFSVSWGFQYGLTGINKGKLKDRFSVAMNFALF